MFAWSHGDAKCDLLICHLWPLAGSLVAGIGVDNLLLSVEQFRRWGADMDMELGTAIKVASMIVPCFMVGSSGILSLIKSMPAKRSMVGTSIRASSMAGSLSEVQCCIRWILSMA
jgi:hypothetical protein